MTADEVRTQNAHLGELPRALDDFYAELCRHHLGALCRINKKLMPFEPRPRAKAWLWRYEDLARIPGPKRKPRSTPAGRAPSRRLSAGRVDCRTRW